MNRDNIIDEKIQSLKELEKKIKDKLEKQEKFITNLKVGSINLRTVNNEQALSEAFEIIYNKEQIEELIQAYLDEFNFEKTVYYE